ncbi:hypothetical protein FJT64_000070 [Amphibalanus amphitrite]|uniref:C2H2-type domain-containing protein n=1 Tax=Amphibalanus amphitrite TaxID=1232801 RepID=A0A6A4XHX0_AMPAM|nr:hypothetical protein FJT64_000070 [Amphibalanus amphitrite]
MVAVARSSPSKLRRLSRASDPADRQCAASSDSDTSDCDDPDFLAEIAPGPSDRPAPVKRSRAADDSASAPRPQKVLCDGVQRSIPAPIVLDSDSDEVTIIDDEPAQKVEHQPTRRAEHQPTQSVNRQPAQRVEQQPTQKVEHQTAQRTEYRTAQKTGHQPGLKTKTDGEGAKTDREGSKTDRLETKTGREGRQTNRVRTYSEQKAAKTTREDAQDAQMKELCRARQALYGFPCPVCDKKSETLTQATLHYHRHDSATALFRCKICDEKFAAWQPNHIRQRHPHIRGPDIFSTIENNFEQGKRNLVRLILEKKKLYSETILDKVMKITVNLTMVRKQRPVTKPPPETSGALAILASAREKEQEQKRAEELKRKKLAALKALRIGKAIKSESGSKRQPIDVKTNDSNTGTARSSVETPQPSTDAKLQTRPESSSRAASASAVRSDNCDGITTCEQCNFRGISVAVRRHAYWHTDEARRRSENLPHSCHLCFYATEVRTHLQVHLMCVHFVERPGWDSGGGRPGKLPRPDPCNAGPPPEEQARCLRQRRYDCPMCDSFFAERSEFAAHVRRLHIKGRSAPRRSLCPFPHCYHKHDADHIKWYHKTAPLRNRICEDCGGTFYYGKDNQHGNGACVRERSESYECPMPICGFGTRLLANMDRHLVECHSLWVRGTAGPRSAPYFCPVCSAEVSYDEFLNHLGQHDEQVEDVDDPGDLESEDPADTKTERRDERAATADGPPAAAPPSGGWSQLSVGRFLTERCSQTLQQEAYSQPRGGYQTRGGVDRCFFCPFRADDTRRLELHLAAAHPQQVTAFDMFLKGCVTKLGTKKCPMCNVGFRAKWALFRHVMSHTMNVPKVEGV